jgi:hypothetical protein
MFNKNSELVCKSTQFYCKIVAVAHPGSIKIV